MIQLTPPAPPRYRDRLLHDHASPSEALAIRRDMQCFPDERVASKAYAVGLRQVSVGLFTHQLTAKKAKAGPCGVANDQAFGGRSLQYSATAGTAMAKCEGANVAGAFAPDAVQMFGRSGFRRELTAGASRYRVQEISRDAAIGLIRQGANKIQKLVIARNIFGTQMTV